MEFGKAECVDISRENIARIAVEMLNKRLVALKVERFESIEGVMNKNTDLLNYRISRIISAIETIEDEYENNR